MSQIETGDIVTKEILEIISHVVAIPLILYQMLLGEFVLWIPLLGSEGASLCYHLCQLGVFFNARLINTLRRADYAAISSLEIAWVLRFMNLTWKPRRKGQSSASYFKELYYNLMFALGVVLCFQVVNNLTMWIIFDTLAGVIVTFGTVLLLFYIVYVQNEERYRLDGYWLFLIDIAFACIGVFMLFYAGNPGDIRYGYWHPVWHFIMVFFELLFTWYVRWRDGLTWKPWPLSANFLEFLDEEEEIKKKV